MCVSKAATHAGCFAKEEEKEMEEEEVEMEEKEKEEERMKTEREEDEVMKKGKKGGGRSEDKEKVG